MPKSLRREVPAGTIGALQGTTIALPGKKVNYCFPVVRKSSPGGTFDSAAWASWLQDRLRLREWKAADFARALGVPNGTVSRWVTGERQPSPASADLIADVLGLDVDDVLTRAGHRPAVEPLAPDDPATDIIAKVKRVKWNPERVDQITADLDLYLKHDKIAREKEKGKEA